MKRDWDLIRAILVAAEEKQPGEMLFAGELPDWPKPIVNAHFELLKDAGYVHAAIIRGLGAGSDPVVAAHISAITNAGYDLLATLRSKDVWERTKVIAKDKGLDLSFEVVKQIGKVALAHALGAIGAG